MGSHRVTYRCPDAIPAQLCPGFLVTWCLHVAGVWAPSWVAAFPPRGHATDKQASAKKQRGPSDLRTAGGDSTLLSDTSLPLNPYPAEKERGCRDSNP